MCDMVNCINLSADLRRRVNGLRLLTEAHQDRDQLQLQLQELQQTHAALQAGVAALQKDRDHLRQQLHITEAELELLAGAQALGPIRQPHGSILCNNQTSTLPSLGHGAAVGSDGQPMHRTTCVQHSPLIAGDEVRQRAVETQGCRALNNLKYALYNRSSSSPEHMGCGKLRASMRLLIWQLHVQQLPRRGAAAATEWVLPRSWNWLQMI